jgi:hypothetical protein
MFTVSCQHVYKNENKLFYSQNTPYIFKLNKEDKLFCKIPAFANNKFELMLCEENDGVYSCFDEFNQKGFQVSFTSSKTGMIGPLKTFNNSDSLIHEFSSTFYQSTNHREYKSKQIFFSVGMNGELIFSWDDKFDDPTTSSVTFLPKYDREFEIVFYENDAYDQLFLSNQSNDKKLKIIAKSEYTSGMFFREYDFEAIER